MSSNTILYFGMIILIAVACQETPGSNTNENETFPIEQIADSIEGQQGKSAAFYLWDYYKSESPITSVKFSSDSVSIEPLDGDSFRVSQPDPLSGEFVIKGELKNEDNQQLNSELTYLIEPKPEPHAIEQIAENIEGEQDKSVTFYLGDYFKSESPITSVKFSSDSVSIEPLDGDSFRVSQPASLSGEFIIKGELKNEDNQQLNSELTYMIEPKPEPETPPSEGVLVIMPLGDSLTNDGRSRATLWNFLTEDGHELDYVGDQKQQGTIPDPDHEGVGGIKIQGIADKAERLMNTHKPEYILLMVGTNNIAWYFDETGEEIAARWNDLIELLFDSSAAGTYIIAATIPPVTSKIVGKEGMDERDRAEVVKTYNSELRDYIENRRENGDNIILADVEDVLNLSEDFADDGVHLNRDGYVKMGTVYYEAMNSALWEQYENN